MVLSMDLTVDLDRVGDDLPAGDPSLSSYPPQTSESSNVSKVHDMDHEHMNEGADSDTPIESGQGMEENDMTVRIWPFQYPSTSNY
ncbi:unnamed protein product [Protopolystoma xenopodis]|uniref:Uncharacterized protein n=1 Tax=Protopolystoma xenopodis TaxID=117903 RepID=A0A448WVC8_9PLAT|nr:unnamed protein product [Protopolystoma xenopodis]